ncbi:unnamed protein product [Owenia fusiformis]|uniref:Ferritin/DPS domain-containing protein n=1 Tax=Owenia fusiformis TaxID=6347 RepID=A0A8J1TTZ8_OWEFU|nr:unnamed protein product [Owenia fusiformis]
MKMKRFVEASLLSILLADTFTTGQSECCFLQVNTCDDRYSSITRNSFILNGLEAKLNECAGKAMDIAYIYQSMQYFFRRDDIAFMGLSKAFRNAFYNEIVLTLAIRDYVDTRGGCVTFPDITAPPECHWCQVDAIQRSLDETIGLCDCLNEAAVIANAAEDFGALEFLSVWAAERVDTAKGLSYFLKGALLSQARSSNQWIFNVLRDWNVAIFANMITPATTKPDPLPLSS